MNTTTNVRVEYAVLALKPDGTWKVMNKAFDEEEADKILKDYLYCVENWPRVYTQYGQYRVAKRTVITTVEEWQEVQP